MAEIKFSTTQRTEIIDKIQRYFSAELEQELEQFDADFLLDFFANNIGNYFYNQGLYDAQQIITDKVEQIAETIVELEKPVL